MLKCELILKFLFLVKYDVLKMSHFYQMIHKDFQEFQGNRGSVYKSNTLPRLYYINNDFSDVSGPFCVIHSSLKLPLK